ncbi:MAG: FkbM family methyltransferase [Tahibacter sp.]
MGKKLHKIRAAEYFARLARMRVTCYLSRARGNRLAARIACFPGDDIGNHIIAHGWYEDLLLEAIFSQFLDGDAARFRGGIAVDVGANIGNHTLWFSRRFAQVLSFEPNPICIKLFEANMLMNGTDNVRLFPLGLSDHDTELMFYANQHENLGRSGVTPALAASATHSFPIKVARGDSLLTNEVVGERTICLIKLDIEGHEHAALTGLRDTLLAHRPLVLFESHHAIGHSGSHAIVAQLAEWGYAHIYVVQTNRSPYENPILKFAYRLLKGLTLSLHKVDRPPDQSYSLIIAATKPQCES